MKDSATLRQALEAGDLKHDDIVALIGRVEDLEDEIAGLNHKLTLGQSWVRTHYRARQRAEKELLTCVRKTVRDSAKMARRWPKMFLRQVLEGKRKPTKEEMALALLVAGNIEQQILKQVEEV